MARGFKGKQLAKHLMLTGSLIVTDGVSGSFSGSFEGDGSALTGISAGGSIFAATGSFQSTTNDLQITGSLDVQSNITSSNLLITDSAVLSGSINTSGSWSHCGDFDITIPSSIGQCVTIGNGPTNRHFCYDPSNGRTSAYLISSQNFSTGADGRTTLNGCFLQIQGNAYINAYQNMFCINKQYPSSGGSTTLRISNCNSVTAPNSNHKLIEFDNCANTVGYVTVSGSAFFSGSTTTKELIVTGSSPTITIGTDDTSVGVLQFSNDNNVGLKITQNSSLSGTTQVCFANGYSNRFNIGSNAYWALESAKTTFNYGSYDHDIQFNGDNQLNLLYVNAGDDRVGICTNSPSASLHVEGDLLITDSAVLSGSISISGSTDINGNTTITGSVYISGSTKISLPTGTAFEISEPDKDQPSRLLFEYTNGDPTLTIASRASTAKLMLRQDASPTLGLSLNEDGLIRKNSTGGVVVDTTDFYPNTNNIVSLGAQLRQWKDIYATGIWYGDFANNLFSIGGTQRSDGKYNGGLVYFGFADDGEGNAFDGSLRTPDLHYLGIGANNSAANSLHSEAPVYFKVGKSGSLSINLDQGDTGMGGDSFKFYTASAMVHVEAEPNWNMDLFRGDKTIDDTRFRVDKEGNTTISGSLLVTKINSSTLQITGSLDVQSNITSSNLLITDSAHVEGTVLSYLHKNEQTAGYTLALSDLGKMVEVSSSSAVEIIIPTNASVAFPTGSQIMVARYGSGDVAFSTSATLRSVAGESIQINSQYGAVTLVKRDTDEWYAFGDISAS